jgi:hypothetical protein
MYKDYKLLGDNSDLGEIHKAVFDWKVGFVAVINRGGVCDAE